MDRLIEGYKRFRETYWAEHREVFEALANDGQAPRALVIACCDSRVPPEMIFNSAPGEIFVVRNVANLVPPYAPDSDNHGTSAALEFAVRKLQVQHIIVMGHSQCGGIHALLHGPDEQTSDFIGPWMAIADDARRHALSIAGTDLDRARPLCEHESIRVSLRNLRGFPWIAERLEAGLLQLHGWYFNLESGDLEMA